MPDHITKLANKLSGFIKSRIALSMFLALQIFIMKTSRPKGLIITGLVLIVAGHIIGMHAGFCPLKNIRPCQYFTGK